LYTLQVIDAKILRAFEGKERLSVCLPIFRKLDPAGKGLIRRDVIMEALTCYGDRMSADQLSEILRKTCDENNSGHNDEFFDYRS
jgi:hypothetical protein